MHEKPKFRIVLGYIQFEASLRQKRKPGGERQREKQRQQQKGERGCICLLVQFLSFTSGPYHSNTGSSMTLLFIKQ